MLVRTAGMLARWTGRLLAVLGLAFLFLLLLIAGYVVLAWPRPSDGLTLHGLHGAVTVRTDDAEVIHIEAQTTRDLWFALGAVHARRSIAGSRREGSPNSSARQPSTPTASCAPSDFLKPPEPNSKGQALSFASSCRPMPTV